MPIASAMETLFQSRVWRLLLWLPALVRDATFHRPSDVVVSSVKNSLSSEHACGNRGMVVQLRPSWEDGEC